MHARAATGYRLLLAALLLGSATAASASVHVVDAEHKADCRFVKFIATRSASSADAALADAMKQAAGYGANAYYVMKRVDAADGRPALIDGQALQCPAP